MHDAKFICWNVFIYMGDDDAVPVFILCNCFLLLFCVVIFVFPSSILTLAIVLRVMEVLRSRFITSCLFVCGFFFGFKAFFGVEDKACFMFLLLFWFYFNLRRRDVV